MDYARSAASLEMCVCCKGKGLIAQKLCIKCNGKGAISCACKDCKGKGTAVDKGETERQGVPVRKICKRCSGRGYERIPASKAFKAVRTVTEDISIATLEKTIRPFYDDLIQECERGETKADDMLKKVTRNFDEV
jgi:DnaJ-class molecular chaperone